LPRRYQPACDGNKVIIIINNNNNNKENAAAAAKQRILRSSSLQNDGDDDDDNSTGSIELDENQDGPCAQHRIDSQSSFSPSSSLSLAQNSSWNSAASSENSFATSTPLAYEPFSILRQATNASKDNDSKNDDLTGR